MRGSVQHYRYLTPANFNINDLNTKVMRISKQTALTGPGVDGALQDFLKVNGDLQVNVQEMNAMLELFSSTDLFADMSGEHRSRLITGHNSTTRLYYRLEYERLKQKIKTPIFE